MRIPIKAIGVYVVLLTAFGTAEAQNTFPSSGNVGIGTASPGALLDVHGSAQIGIDNWDTQTSSPVQVLRLYANGVSGVAPYSAFNFNTVAGYNWSNKLEINSWDDIYGGTAPLFTLQGNGNVGIGTTTPAYTLDVAGQIRSSSGGIVFPDGSTQATAYNQVASGSNVITQSGGNVGIGTTVPGAPLEVNGNAQVDGNISATAPSARAVTIAATNSSSNAAIIMAEAGSGSSGFAGTIGANMDGIVGFAANGMAISNYNGPLYLGGYYHPWVTLSNGNVGVGTTTPGAKLDVGDLSGGGTLETVFSRLGEGNTTGDGTYLGVKSWCTQVSPCNSLSFSIEHHFYGQTNSSINFYRGGGTQGGFMTFATNNNNEQMRITSSGNVGIGTASPTQKLSIMSGVSGNPATSGTTQAGGAVRINGSDNGILDIGEGNAGNYWLQATDKTTLAQNYNLSLNPNGGNVGIGTTTPSAKFEVNGGIKLTSGSGGGITFADGSTQSTASSAATLSGTSLNSSVTSSSLTSVGTLSSLNVSGNVGIGTTSPGAPLGIVGDSGTTQATIAYIKNGHTGASTGFDSAGESSVVGTWTNGSQILEFVPQLGGNGIVSSYTGNLLFQTNGRANQMAITSSGNVGIGTTTPGAKLEVDGNVILTAGSGANVTFQDGTVQSTAWNGVLPGGDYAESVSVTGERKQYEPGDVMVIDPDSPDKFLKASEPYSTMVAGIYSTKPGVTGRHQQNPDPAWRQTEVPMAMIGIVPTKVSAENGAIKPGDLLVASSIAGYAMKGTDRERLTGAVIGKAMGHLDSGKGVIQVLVTLQ